MVLVELLIAATIAALLIAVILTVYGSILNTVTIQNLWREKTTPAASALDVISRDLACAVIPFGVTNQPFTAEFTGTSGEKFQMSFYSAFPVSSGTSNDWRNYSISRVCYSWQAGGGTNGFVLTRKCNPFRVPSRNLSPAEENKWPGIKKINIAFFDGSAWTNQWGKSTNTLPQSARIGFITGENDSREISSEVFINASRQIAPRKKK
jgi:hypothetical protein